MQMIYPGIWKMTLGEPESATPVNLRYQPPAISGLQSLTSPSEAHLALEVVTGRQTARGYVVELPLEEDEQIYGFGLQLLSFNQRDLKKTLRVNSDPKGRPGRLSRACAVLRIHPRLWRAGGYGALRHVLCRLRAATQRPPRRRIAGCHLQRDLQRTGPV